MNDLRNTKLTPKEKQRLRNRISALKSRISKKLELTQLEVNKNERLINVAPLGVPPGVCDRFCDSIFSKNHENL